MLLHCWTGYRISCGDKCGDEADLAVWKIIGTNSGCLAKISSWYCKCWNSWTAFGVTIQLLSLHGSAIGTDTHSCRFIDDSFLSFPWFLTILQQLSTCMHTHTHRQRDVRVCVFLSRALTYTYMWTHFFKYVQFLICKLTDTVSPGRFTATERVQVYVFRSKWRLLQHGRMAFEQAASLLPTVSLWGSGAVKRREGETAIYFIDTSPFFAGLMSKKYMFCQVGFYVCHRPGLFSLEIVPFLGVHQGLPVLRVCSPIVLQITTMMPTSRNISPFANGRRKHKCRMHMT
jgi:hypothetical protein